MSGSGCGAKSKLINLAIQVCGMGSPPANEGALLFDKPLAPTTSGSIFIMTSEADRIGGWLCGGAVRDFLLLEGKEVKDFDIFIPNDKKERQEVDRSLFGNGFAVPDDYIDKTRKEVLAIDKYNSVSVDVILIDRTDVVSIVETFDSSICEAWTEWEDNTAVVYCSNAFLRYVLGQPWELYKNVDTSNGHIERLQAKFGPEVVSESQPISKVRLGTLDEALDTVFRLHALAREFYHGVDVPRS